MGCGYAHSLNRNFHAGMTSMRIPIALDRLLFLLGYDNKALYRTLSLHELGRCVGDVEQQVSLPGVAKIRDGGVYAPTYVCLLYSTKVPTFCLA